MRENVTIKFVEQGEPEIGELSLFLRELKSVYSLVFRVKESLPDEFSSVSKSISKIDVEQIRSVITSYLERHHSDVAKSFLPNRFFKMKESSENELLVEKISRESPLEITVCGIGIAVVTAVILSGGKFSAGLFSLEIDQPLSKSIKDMRDVFKRSDPHPAERNVRPSDLRGLKTGRQENE